MSNLALLVAALGLLASAASARAEMQPASAEQIGEAVAACLLAVDGDAVVADELVSQGWEQATISADGRSVDTPLAVFGKSGNRALIMTAEPGDSGHAPCLVIGRLPSTKQYHPTAKALSRIIGQPTKREGNEYFWSLDGKAAQLAPTGSREEPALRFVIANLEGNSQ